MAVSKRVGNEPSDGTPLTCTLPSDIMAERRSQFGERIVTCWMSRVSLLFSRLSSNVVRECCLFLYGDLQRLLAFQATRVMWFDPGPGLWKDFCPFTSPINFQYTALFVSPDQVLVSGKHVHPDTTAFLLNAQGERTLLKSLLVPRCYHGLAADWRLEVVFAFGGCNDSNPHTEEKLNSIEKLRLPDNPWELLEPMQHPRSHFNPCCRYPYVYLAGGGSTAIEVFSQETEKCETLPCALPSDFLEVGCLSVFCAGLLVVLCRKRLCRVKLSTTELVDSVSHKPVLLLPRCQPCLRGQVLYTVDWYLVCRGLSIETGAVSSEADCPGI